MEEHGLKSDNDEDALRATIEQTLVVLAALLVVVITDFKFCTVGGKTAGHHSPGHRPDKDDGPH